MINFLPLEGETASDNGASMWIMFAVYAVFIAALYLIFFRPQSKRKKKEEQMRKAKEREEYERPLKAFISSKIKESGLSEKDFKKQVCSSCDYLKDRATKSRYFCERPDLLEKYYNERLIRFSIKGTDGKVGKIEIYTDTGELIFERYKTK